MGRTGRHKCTAPGQGRSPDNGAKRHAPHREAMLGSGGEFRVLGRQRRGGATRGILLSRRIAPPSTSPSDRASAGVRRIAPRCSRAARRDEQEAARGGGADLESGRARARDGGSCTGTRRGGGQRERENTREAHMRPDPSGCRAGAHKGGLTRDQREGRTLEGAARQDAAEPRWVGPTPAQHGLVPRLGRLAGGRGRLEGGRGGGWRGRLAAWGGRDLYAGEGDAGRVEAEEARDSPRLTRIAGGDAQCE